MSKERINIINELWFLIVLSLTIALGLLIFYFGLPRFVQSSSSTEAQGIEDNSTAQAPDF